MKTIKKGFIGEKSRFAIEYEFLTYNNKRLFEKNLIWIKNQYVGNYNDENILGVFGGSIFNDLRRKQELPTELKGKSYEEIYEFLFNTEDSKYDKFMALYGAAFDDFFVYNFILDNEFCFLWKLANELNFPSAFEGYSRNIQVACVSREYVLRIVHEFDSMQESFRTHFEQDKT